MRSDYDIALPPDTDLRALVKTAYALSSPQGLGHLHAREGELDDATVDDILSRSSPRTRLSMDYTHGRSIKFHVRQDDDGLYVNSVWYDHFPSQYIELLGSVGIPESTILAAQAALDKANAEYDAAQRKQQEA